MDYKDHVVLQFTTLGQENEPELKFKFLRYDTIDVENTSGKNKTIDNRLKTLLKTKEIIKFEDVVSKNMDKTIKNNTSELYGHLKLYW